MNVKEYIQISLNLFYSNSVENRRSRQMEIFGRELMKKKQDGECLPQIVEFSIEDLNAASILKNLICGMTKYIPKNRTDVMGWVEKCDGGGEVGNRV